MKTMMKFAGRRGAVACAVGVTLFGTTAQAGDPCSPEPILNASPFLNSWSRAVLSTDGALYFSGIFTLGEGDAALGYIGRREGQGWNSLGGGMNSWVTTLAAVDGHGAGGGEVLYAGGLFTEAGGVEANFIAGWDASTGAWSPLGDGLNGYPDRLTTYTPPGGGDSLLLVSGSFTTAGGLQAKGLAAWDGTRWSNIGDVEGGTIYAFTMFDDGGGPALYAGGSFVRIGGVDAGGLARWEGPGGGWVAVASVNGTVRALLGFDDGTGRALYVGGRFSEIGGVEASNIARFDPASSQWSALGDGLPGVVHALAVYGDGEFADDAPVLWAGGTFPRPPSEPLWFGNRGMARWNGSEWHVIEWGTNFWGYGVRSLVVHIEDGVARLHSTGPQHLSSSSVHWAWQGCPSSHSACTSPRTVVAGTTPIHNFNAPTDGPADCDASDEDWSDVWFAYEVTCDDLVKIRMCAHDFPARIAVYSACPADSGEALACGGGSCDPGEPSIELSGAAGEVLLIRIGGTGGAQGAGVLRITCGPLTGDLNGDGVVDVLDLLILLGEWGPCPAKGDCAADLNGDGAVDVLDLLILLAHWG